MAKTVGPGPHRGDVRRNGARRRVAWAIFRQAFWSMRWIVAAAIAIMLVVSGINAVQPLLYRLLFDTAVPEADYGLIAAVVAGIVVAPIAAIGITYASQYLRTLIAYRVSAGLREAVLPHLLRARMGFLESRTPVDLMFRITRETGRIGELYVGQELLPFVQNAITLTATMVLMVVVDARLAAAALIALPITYLITARLTGRSRVLDKLLTRHTARGEQFLTETFRGIGTVRMLGGEAVHEAQWRGWLRRFLHLRTRSIPLHSMLLTFPNDVVSNVVIGGMLAYGAVRHHRRDADAGGDDRVHGIRASRLWRAPGRAPDLRGHAHHSQLVRTARRPVRGAARGGLAGGSGAGARREHRLFETSPSRMGRARRSTGSPRPSLPDASSVSSGRVAAARRRSSS